MDAGLAAVPLLRGLAALLRQLPGALIDKRLMTAGLAASDAANVERRVDALRDAVRRPLAATLRRRARALQLDGDGVKRRAFVGVGVEHPPDVASLRFVKL